MSEQSTEVKGFKNSVLGKVLFKIAAVAGLQDALDGKAAINHSHNVSEITGMDAALAAFSHIVATLPAASGANVGYEYLYIGQSSVSRQFGQTYQCQEKYKAYCTLNGNTQDEQEKSGVLNHCKTLRSVTGGKYVMRSYSEIGDSYTVELDVYPNSSSVLLSDLYAAIVTDILSAESQANIDVDGHSDQSASRRKEWVAKFSQEIVPVY